MQGAPFLTQPRAQRTCSAQLAGGRDSRRWEDGGNRTRGSWHGHSEILPEIRREVCGSGWEAPWKRQHPGVIGHLVGTV